jgi:hypothetical protein
MSRPQGTSREEKVGLKSEKDRIELLRVKIVETQKISERTQKRIRELMREEVRILTTNKVKLDKLQKETQEKIRIRTEKRLEELRLEFLRKEKEEDSLPS